MDRAYLGGVIRGERVVKKKKGHKRSEDSTKNSFLREGRTETSRLGNEVRKGDTLLRCEYTNPGCDRNYGFGPSKRDRSVPASKRIPLIGRGGLVVHSQGDLLWPTLTGCSQPLHLQSECLDALALSMWKEILEAGQAAL